MDIGKIKNSSLVVWVPFMEGARLQIRHIPRDEFQGLVEQATTREMIAGELKENFNNGRFNDLLCERAVVGLDGIEEDGQPVPFSSDLVKLLEQKSSQFVTTVRAACTDLEKLLVLDREQTRKNS